MMSVINMLMNFSMASILMLGMSNPIISHEREKQGDNMDPKLKPTGHSVAFNAAKAAFEKCSTSSSPAVASSPPRGSQTKPKPPVPPRPKALFVATATETRQAEPPQIEVPRPRTSSKPLVADSTLPHALVKQIFEAPYGKSNIPGSPKTSSNDVAGTVPGPNGTEICHKLAYPGNERILRLLNEHLTAVAVKDSEESGNVNTFGPNYDSIHAIYILYANDMKIKSSEFRVAIHKKKEG